MAQQQQQILKMVASGELRPQFTDSCPASVLSLASLCMEAEPSKRPTAAEIVYELQQMRRSPELQQTRDQDRFSFG
ncbi:hypothetical protein ATCC90586_011509 [Pythium insidiosum]|nr:hypothetical protein ATCC90586_011509 [Pythium insidiosum]